MMRSMPPPAGQGAVAFLAQRGHHRQPQAVARQLHQLGGKLAGFGILDHQFFHDVSFRFLDHWLSPATQASQQPFASVRTRPI